MWFNMVRDGHIYGKAEVLIVKETMSGLKVREIDPGYAPRVNDKLEHQVSIEKPESEPSQEDINKPQLTLKSPIDTYFLGSAGLIISESDIGISTLLGLQSFFRRFGLTINPADLGWIPEENQNSRYRKETLSNGRTICRDLSNGQFTDSENCAGTFRTIYAFSIDATYRANTSKYPLYLGMGYRFGNNSGPYLAGVVGYDLGYDKLRGFFKTHIGSNLLLLSAGILIIM
jgi:hypothetical protein